MDVKSGIAPVANKYNPNKYVPPSAIPPEEPAMEYPCKKNSFRELVNVHPPEIVKTKALRQYRFKRLFQNYIKEKEIERRSDFANPVLEPGGRQ
jgi:hypothetical protein